MSAVHLFCTNRPNYHQYTLLQVATGTQIPAAKSEVNNSSHYYLYLKYFVAHRHISSITGCPNSVQTETSLGYREHQTRFGIHETGEGCKYKF